MFVKHCNIYVCERDERKKLVRNKKEEKEKDVCLTNVSCIGKKMQRWYIIIILACGKWKL